MYDLSAAFRTQEAGRCFGSPHPRSIRAQRLRRIRKVQRDLKALEKEKGNPLL